MTHWKLTVSYDGTDYSGWQVQPGLATVQGTLAGAIQHITGEAVLPQGSGRTDAGVHALAQVASFTLQSNIPADNLLRALNRSLPSSIRVFRAEPVDASFHARHSARGKTYEYRIFERKPFQGDGNDPLVPYSPFLARYVWDCPWALDLAAMQRAGQSFCGTHNFTSFAAGDPELNQRASPEAAGVTASAPNPVKTVRSSQWTHQDGLLLYRIHGSGFLHHMVRNIVGTLAEVGRGALLPEDIPRILAARDRTAAGPTAPASGLFLHSVNYEAGGWNTVHQA
jgi:tRNA pseudouridine38-40 synthase